ncbi:MAG: hypothetical protein E7158_00780 [Firmicutes bacterium]|nr:hypothetical protein [Bacillota bacterium]
MNKLKELFDYYFNIICTLLLIFMISGICFLIYKDVIKKENVSISKNQSSKITINENNDANVRDENVKNTIKVDIKGFVKKPNVYEIKNGANVSDLINIAGGLAKNATTDNINLSRKLEDQMVIRIANKNELKKKDNHEISECVCKNINVEKCSENAITKIDGNDINAIITDNEESTNNISNTNIEDNTIVSLNTSSKEKLMTLPGVGESKAIAIIEYREKNNGFKNIEEIKNVSGIGDALFEKIKDNISL